MSPTRSSLQPGRCFGPLSIGQLQRCRAGGGRGPRAFPSGSGRFPTPGSSDPRRTGEPRGYRGTASAASRHRLGKGGAPEWGGARRGRRAEVAERGRGERPAQRALLGVSARAESPAASVALAFLTLRFPQLPAASANAFSMNFEMPIAV